MFEIGKVDLTIEGQTCKFEQEDIARLRKFRMSIAKRFKKPFYSINPDWQFLTKNIKMLMNKYSEYFDIWWHPKMIDIIYKSEEDINVSILQSLWSNFKKTKYKDCWLKPDLIDWNKHLINFMNHYEYEEFAALKPDFLKDDKIVCKLTSWMYTNQFDTIWNEITPEQQDMLREREYWSLISSCNKHFDLWWKKEMLTEGTFSYFLNNCSEHIDKWWDSDILTFDLITTNLSELIKVAHSKFPSWFNKESWNYKYYSIILPLYFSEYFDLWWDPKKFNYMQKIEHRYNHRMYEGAYTSYSIILKIQSTLDYEHNEAEESLRDYMYARDLLYLCCSDQFNKWWSGKYFKAAAHTFILLDRHCSKYSEKFRNSMYLIWKLQNEEVKKIAS